MKFIAKEIELNNIAYNGKHLALCIFSKDPELLELIVSAYPIVTKSHTDPLYIAINGDLHRVVAFISKEANAYDGEVLNEKDLFWYDPKALHYHSKPEYFPLEKYLYIDKPGWISNEIKIRRRVYRIL